MASREIEKKKVEKELSELMETTLKLEDEINSLGQLDEE